MSVLLIIFVIYMYKMNNFNINNLNVQCTCSFFLSMKSTNRFVAMGLGRDADDRGIDAR